MQFVFHGTDPEKLLPCHQMPKYNQIQLKYS